MIEVGPAPSGSSGSSHWKTYNCQHTEISGGQVLFKGSGLKMANNMGRQSVSSNAKPRFLPLSETDHCNRHQLLDAFIFCYLTNTMVCQVICIIPLLASIYIFYFSVAVHFVGNVK